MTRLSRHLTSAVDRTIRAKEYEARTGARRTTRRDLDQSNAQRTAHPMVPGSRGRRNMCADPPTERRVPPPIRTHEHAAGGSWRLASRAKRTPHRQRSVYRCAGGTLLRNAQAKLAPPPPAAAFSTQGSLGAAMPRRHGPLRRHCGSLQVRSNAIRGRQACTERAAFATSRTDNAMCGVRAPGYCPYLVGRVLAPVSRDDRSSRALEAAI